MLAIHNTGDFNCPNLTVANAFAKLSKCQQFTTTKTPFIPQIQLQTLLQSYQNVSNSQRVLANITTLVSCKRFCKVIKMLAIHNQERLEAIEKKVANAYAKLSKCQQFTTVGDVMKVFGKLQTLMQSYQNVSNSQPLRRVPLPSYGCKRLCKVIKMLAIHNLYDENGKFKRVANAYAKLSKCQQFTTNLKEIFSTFKLQTLMQSYQNVSNSQQLLCKISFVYSCKRLCKVIKMLAIHN